MNTLRPVARFLERIFGIIIWSPPAWLSRTGRWVAAHRVAAVLAFVVVIMSTGGGAWWYIWYSHRPPPHRVEVSAADLPVTPLRKEELVPPLIEVKFGESAAPLAMIDKHVDAGITLDPPVEGYWRWDTDRLLTFTPAHDWPADTLYHITLDRKAIARHVLLARYALDVHTPEFKAAIEKLEFYQDPKDPTMKKVVSTLNFTHAVSPGEVEKYLHLTMVGGTEVFPKGVPQFTVDLGMHNRLAYIHTARLDLPEKEDFLKLLLEKGFQTAQGGAATKWRSLAQTGAGAEPGDILPGRQHGGDDRAEAGWRT